MTSRTRGVLGASVLLALFLPMAVDALWKSDEERVEEALAGMERGLEAGDADAVIARFAEGAEARCRVAGLPPRLPLPEALRAALDCHTEIRLYRSETSMTFPEAGTAEVRTHGVGSGMHAEYGSLPFRFELKLRLRRSEDGRFLLQSVDSADVALGS